MASITFKVDGMSCQHCVKAVEGALNKLDGVRSAAVDLGKGTARVEYDESRVKPEQMKAAIEDQGYDVA